MGEGQLNKVREKLRARWKRQTPASAFRHAIRIATIIAKASFWAASFHYFGSKTLLLVAASWMFVLGIKDLTFARVRMPSLKDPAKRARSLRKSVTAELALMALRLGVFAGISAILVPFERNIAAIVSLFTVCAGFWTRETFISIGTAFRTSRWRTYIAFIAAAGAIGSVIYFAENNFDPVRSAIWALLIREAVSFFGYAGVALLGAVGIQPPRKKKVPIDEEEEDEDEDGGAAASVVAADGREIRSAWKLLIADNVIYSRWRMMHFATRLVAHGILGPFGSVATRIAFAYRRPQPYKHHASRIAIGKVIGLSVAAAVTISTIIYLAQRAGLLEALGIVVAAFLFRLVALSLNLLFWRQLSPIVGRQKSIPAAAGGER
ncbi:MAG TPA: hypothetical protein VFO12_11300 [Sphingomicrobium sp.]|nr:hypothetical protein [Sphingomicrobium sp.]